MKYRAKRDSARGKPKVVFVLSTSHGAAMKNTNRSGCRWECYIETNKYYWLQPQYGWCMLIKSLNSLDVLRKSYVWYKKLFVRLVMECALDSHKLYKKEGGKDDLLFFLQDVCTLLPQNAPRLERNPSRVAIDNFARLTGRNHWPDKRNSWRMDSHEMKNQKMQSLSAKRMTHKEWKTHKNSFCLQGMPRGIRTLCGKRMLWTVPYPVWL